MTRHTRGRCARPCSYLGCKGYIDAVPDRYLLCKGYLNVGNSCIPVGIPAVVLAVSPFGYPLQSRYLSAEALMYPLQKKWLR